MSRTRWYLISVALLGCGGGDVPLPHLDVSAIADTSGLIERGEYIVRNVAVCGQCHAAKPGERDGPLSGGMEFKDWRLGTIRAANITPDSATGIGTWTEREIVRAIRAGEDHEGDIIAPVMPYEWFNGMSDYDALAVARYLKTRAPVRNDVDNDPSLIYKFAKAFVLKAVDARSPTRGPMQEPTAAYGKYLANHVSLCADCHTPRSGIQNAHDLDMLFAGSAEPPSSFPAAPSNLTPDKATGIGEWTELDFIRTLKTGVTPAGDSVHVFMPWQQFRRMSDDDLAAIYRYLRTLRPIRNEIPDHQHHH